VWSNWSREQSCAPAKVATPANTQEVIDEIAAARTSAWIDDTGFPVNLPMEIRLGAGDDTLPSPEGGARPHWGKRHVQTAATLRPRHPMWDRFAELRDRCDPDRVFANAHLDRVLGP
jgi:hypothetical protein